MKPRTLTLTVAARAASAALPTPAIWWPSIDLATSSARDSATVPIGDELHFRWQAAKTDGRHEYFRGPFFPSRDFVAAGRSARDRVWILDKFFWDERGRAALESILSSTQVRSFRVISLKAPPSAELDRLRSMRASSGAFAPGELQWQSLNSREAFPYVHDRFAIVDAELWHFGSTVGGAHETLQAYTRGFDAEATGMARFFAALWVDTGGTP